MRRASPRLLPALALLAVAGCHVAPERVGQITVRPSPPAEVVTPAPRVATRRSPEMRPSRLRVTSRLALRRGAETIGRTPETPTPTCPRIKGKPNAYAVGSSTMGSVLGPILERQVKKRWKLPFRKWGKASSGLSRPDFHDWPKEIPSLNWRYDPEFYVVSLGTNDAQPLKTKKGWIRTDNPKWPVRYGQRVDRMLDLMAGEERRRMIIWLGPTAFRAKNSRELGPIIDRVIRERIEAFEGNAVYIDAFSATSPRRGRYIKTVQVPGKKKREPAWASDNIHLSTQAVRWLLAEPVLRLLGDCLDEPEPAVRRGIDDEIASGSTRRDLDVGAAAAAEDAEPATNEEISEAPPG